MNIKSFNRFCLFGLALVATITFIGIRGFQFTPLEKSDLVVTAKFNSVHNDAPADQPFEVEDKEEQPETEDNESSEDGFATIVFGYGQSPIQLEIFISEKDQVVSKSQARYHTPGYVRLRSILI